MMNIINKIFGSSNDRYIRAARADINAVNALESQMKKLSDAELQAKTVEFRTKLDNGASLDDLMHESFAVCREAAWRVLKMRHYDVQLIGGKVMHEGKIAEMRTGEGKTLTATLALYLNALSGNGAHLVTVNDYLASRDAEWMGRVYKFLGMSVGIITNDLSDAERRTAYGSDITYGTNNEFGFDYLRDNMKYDLESYVQRPLNYAIVDEVDSILIDEARTPLIISGSAGQSTELPYLVNQYVPYLKKDEDYLVDEEHRSVSLTDSGVEKLEDKLDIPNLYDPAKIEVVHAVQKALQAHTLYKKDDRYIVNNGEVIIVDEFTGRPMPGRRWSDGLHQAIEAKEGVEIRDENQTLATVTFQNFFRMYDKLSGMTGTALTESEEFHEIYNLGVIAIPTNKPVIRDDMEDVVYRSYPEKFNAIVDHIVEANEKGQPVLVGTTSVEKSEAISHVLKKKKIPHNVLNAKQHEREATVVAQAGRLGSVTIATNMAGRGTDILLGGNPEAMAEEEAGKQEIPDTAFGEERKEYMTPEYRAALEKYTAQCQAEKQEVLDAGGLFIVGTERHESRRIDNQLRGRAGRQGDPGRSRFFLSLEDELMRLFGGERIAKIMDTLKMEEGVPIEHPMVTRSLENAQRKVEARNFDIRKNVLEYDDVMDQQRKTVYGLRKVVLRGLDEEGRDLRGMALDLFEEVAVATIDNYASRMVRPEDWDLEGLETALREVFSMEFDLTEYTGREPLEAYVWGQISARFAEKEEMVEKLAERINGAPTNGNGGDWAHEEDDDKTTGREILNEQIQSQYLRSIDRFWRQHLQAMEQLRDGIGMRGYAQKDPKQEYKKEGYNLFLDLLMNIKTSVVRFVSTFQLQETQRPAPAPQPNVPKQIFLNRDEAGDGEKPAPQPQRELPKVGRNDPCPCGSGKKYKHCHGRKGAPELSL